MMIYFLIGLPGSGKSFWANKLKHELHFKTFDLDSEIELQAGTTILELFQISEAHFRQKEQEVLLSIIEQAKTYSSNILIATGGGTPCFLENLTLMKKSGMVLFLQSSIINIFERLKNKTANRPLLPESKMALYQQLCDLEKARNPFYEQADIILDAKSLTLPIFAKILNSN